MELRIDVESRWNQQAMLSPGRVVIAETGNNQYQQLLCSGRHVLLADRSAQDGGGETGPDPRALMMMALGSYISMAVRTCANARSWDLEQILVHFDDPAARRREVPGEGDTRAPRITCAIELLGRVDGRQHSQLVEVANQHLSKWQALTRMVPTSA